VLKLCFIVPAVAGPEDGVKDPGDVVRALDKWAVVVGRTGVSGPAPLDADAVEVLDTLL